MPPSAESPQTLDHVGSSDYARRFGRMLRRERRARRRSRQELAAKAGTTLSTADLGSYERGEVRLTVADVERLTDLYDLDLSEVERGRQVVVIDLDNGQLDVAGDVVALPADADPAEALARYVDVVNRLRSRPMRTPATLRTDDARALAEAFELEAGELTALLAEALAEHAAPRRRLHALCGSGSLAVVVVLGIAGATLADRGQAALEGALTPTAANAGPDDHDDPGTAASTEPPPLADPDTRFGPDLDPGQDLRERAAEATEATPGEEAEPNPEPGAEPSPSSEPPEEGFVDETNIDAPGGPVVIEAEEP